MQMRIQLGLLAIRLFNLLYSAVLLVPLRRVLLRALGCRIGRGTGLHDGVRFTWPGRLQMGDSSTVNMGCFLDTRGGIEIGSNTMVGQFSSIYTMTHDLASEDFASVRRGVSIGSGVVIFPHVRLMPGVRVGDAAVVYPGSVVTQDVAPGDIVAGVPARVVGRREGPVRYTLAYAYSFANA